MRGDLSLVLRRTLVLGVGSGVGVGVVSAGGAVAGGGEEVAVGPTDGGPENTLTMGRKTAATNIATITAINAPMMVATA
jgi:hypothetical protein